MARGISARKSGTHEEPRIAERRAARRAHPREDSALQVPHGRLTASPVTADCSQAFFVSAKSIISQNPERRVDREATVRPVLLGSEESRAQSQPQAAD